MSLIDEIALPAYNGMTDAEITDVLNLENIQVNKISMTRQEVLAEIEPSALATLSGDDAVKVFGILSDDVDPFGNAAQVLIDAFGGGSQTITNLAAARKELISRGQQLGIGLVKASSVTFARTGAY